MFCTNIFGLIEFLQNNKNYCLSAFWCVIDPLKLLGGIQVPAQVGKGDSRSPPVPSPVTYEPPLIVCAELIKIFYLKQYKIRMQC